jgi:hypothetical protein
VVQNEPTVNGQHGAQCQSSAQIVRSIGNGA